MAEQLYHIKSKIQFPRQSEIFSRATSSRCRAKATLPAVHMLKAAASMKGRFTTRCRPLNDYPFRTWRRRCLGRDLHGGDPGDGELRRGHGGFPLPDGAVGNNAAGARGVATSTIAKSISRLTEFYKMAGMRLTDAPPATTRCRGRSAATSNGEARAPRPSRRSPDCRAQGPADAAAEAARALQGARPVQQSHPVMPVAVAATSRMRST